MNTLYFSDTYVCVPDIKAISYASALKENDIYTSNELVIFAARYLLKQKRIPLFNINLHKRTYSLNKDARFINGSPPDFYIDVFLDGLL